MSRRILELFGDWLMFDGERLAKLPAGWSPAKRMLLVETLDAVHGPSVDLSHGELERAAVVLNDKHRIVGEHHPGPVLPTDYYTAIVVRLDELTEVLQKADIEVTT